MSSQAKNANSETSTDILCPECGEATIRIVTLPDKTHLNFELRCNDEDCGFNSKVSLEWSELFLHLIRRVPHL